MNQKGVFYIDAEMNLLQCRIFKDRVFFIYSTVLKLSKTNKETITIFYRQGCNKNITKEVINIVKVKLA